MWPTLAVRTRGEQSSVDNRAEPGGSMIMSRHTQTLSPLCCSLFASGSPNVRTGRHLPNVNPRLQPLKYNQCIFAASHCVFQHLIEMPPAYNWWFS